MTTITPFLWFDNQLEEAMTFYASVFPDAEITNVQRQGPDGPVFTASFKLAGQKFSGLNGGPQFRFNEAVSFMVSCKDQEEVDHYWDKLTADGGEESMCAWLKDKYGLSWQIVPDALFTYISGPDAAGRQRATEAMLKMRKIIIADLKSAYEGRA